MDSPLPLQALLACLLPLILIYYYYSCNSKSNTKKINHQKTPPEPSGAWPIIGHFPLLSRPGPLCRTLAALADKHGPVFSLRLGARRTVVVSGLAEAKECFTSNDRALAGRTESAASHIMAYDYAVIGFSTYGPYWREVRKIAIIELLSNARLDALAHVQRGEVDESVKALRARCAEDGGTSATVEMRKWFGELTFNSVVKMVAGRQCLESTRNDEGDLPGRFRKATTDFFMLFGMLVPSDMVPVFKWVDWKGYKAAMRRTAEEIDAVLVRWLEDHRRRQSGGGEVEGDFMDVMLSIIDKAEVTTYDPDTIIKATCLVLNCPDEICIGYSVNDVSEYDTAGTSVKAALVYLGTALVKLVCLATFLKVPENDGFDPYQVGLLQILCCTGWLLFG
ncbi:hypothetical protein QJS10_CPB17g02552 [Acorus calamus]|uniref:Cytochrome P450 n=1 Tax=Acorus calamus TaxID=4465 RepID=A0AAV9CRX8_ACOCL|nr:hypothetical protein QJS10_CPB17g02552 [Acorus calamus]